MSQPDLIKLILGKIEEKKQFERFVFLFQHIVSDSSLAKITNGSRSDVIAHFSRLLSLIECELKTLKNAVQDDLHLLLIDKLLAEPTIIHD